MCHVGGVLGYGAYAGKKDEIHAEWRASMAELATCPNVSVKLERVPQRRVSSSHLVHRKIALESAPFGTEQLDTRFNIGPPNRRPGRRIRRRQPAGFRTSLARAPPLRPAASEKVDRLRSAPTQPS